MTGRQFTKWRKSLKLSIQEAADALGLSKRTVNDYGKAEKIPTAVAMACRAMERDPLVLSAHFKPRKAGRPRLPRDNATGGIILEQRQYAPGRHSRTPAARKQKKVRNG